MPLTDYSKLLHNCQKDLLFQTYLTKKKYDDLEASEKKVRACEFLLKQEKDKLDKEINTKNQLSKDYKWEYGKNAIAVCIPFAIGVIAGYSITTR